MSPELKQAITLIKSGQKEAGKEILLQILNEDENSDTAWLWMTATVDTDELRMECLEEALRINPDNEKAQRGYQKIMQRMQQREDEELENVWHAEPEAIEQPTQWEEQTTTKSDNEWSYYNYQQRPEPELNTAVTNKSHNPLKTSPWITIFYAPRATVSAILQSNEPQKHTLLIMILWGVMWSLMISIIFALISWTWFVVVLVITLITIPISSIIILYIRAIIYGWLGYFVGGTGSSSDVRTAIAWSYVPRMAVYLLNLLATPFVVLSIMAQDFTDITTAFPQVFSTIYPFLIAGALINLWLFYIFLKCLSAAHRYSALNALGTVLLPAIVMYAVTFVLSFLIRLTAFMN